MNEIVMPKLSDTMTEGRIVSWKKQVGEKVQRGDVLAEVETDKANMELEAFTSGVLLEIRVPAGEQAQVGTVIAVVGAADEKGAPTGKPAAAPQAAPAAQAQPASGQAPAAQEPSAAQATSAAPAAQAPSVPAEPAKAAPRGEPSEAAEVPGEKEPSPVAQTPEQVPEGAGAPAESKIAVQAQPPVAPSVSGGAEAGKAEPTAGAESIAPHGERAAPVVRRRARELGIDLGQVEGSGPEGRILLQDLERQQPAHPGTAPEGKAPVAEGPEPLSRLRAAVARTVSESWRTIPHFSVTSDVIMDEAEATRRQLKDCGFEVTLNDLVVKGVALALPKFPRLNASFAAAAIDFHGQISIGVAVGVPDGVLMPVIAGCQDLSLLEISSAGRRLVERARSGALSEQEMSGGTFSVSNLGMYGVSQFNAIIFPPQAAVLAVGAVGDAVVARDGFPVCARLMKLTLCADHRVVDGAYAAEFLAELKDTLEKPIRLLI